MQDIIKTQEDIRFDQILDAQGYDIKAFYIETPHNLFQNANTYPQFFNQNLVSPSRIIKQLINNPNSNIRIFYFQLLRVSYQIQTAIGFNRNFIRNLIRIVFNSQYEIFFTSQTEAQRNLFNDFQFKKLFAGFIQMLQNQQSPNIQQIINCFPIIDTIFIHIFRSIMIFQNVNLEYNQIIPSEILYPTLAEMLGMNISLYDKCWKFQDSDMYSYEQNDHQYYIAYTVQYLVQQSQSNNPNIIMKIKNEQEQIFIIHNSQYSDVKKIQRQSMVSQAYQFGDFTNTSTLFKQKNNSIHEKMKVSAQQSAVYLNNDSHLYTSHVVPATFHEDIISIPLKRETQENIFFEIPNVNTNKIEKKLTKQNSTITKIQIPDYYSNINDNFYEIQQALVIPEQGIEDQATPIYKLSNNHKLKQTVQLSTINENKYQNLSAKSNFNQLGDYYKDFTNSFTLQKVNEPSRTNIRNIKNRMKGLRRSGVNPQNYFQQQIKKFNQQTPQINYNTSNLSQNSYLINNYSDGNFSKNNKYMDQFNYKLPKSNYYY